MSGRIVIHRKPHPNGARRWFTYDGRDYYVMGGNAMGGNEGWGYEVYDVETDRRVQDGYFTLDQLREEFPGDVKRRWDEDKHPAVAGGGTPDDNPR